MKRSEPELQSCYFKPTTMLRISSNYDVQDRALNVGVPLDDGNSSEDEDRSSEIECDLNLSSMGMGPTRAAGGEPRPLMLSNNLKLLSTDIGDDVTVPTSNRSSKLRVYERKSPSPTFTSGFKVSEMWGHFIERAAEMASQDETLKYDAINNNKNSIKSRRPSKFHLSTKFPTPLYEAVALNARPYVLRRLIAVHPAALRIPNAANGSLPLHCAITRYDTSEDIIELLLGSDPSVANVRDAKGLTPLDLLWTRYVNPEDSRCQQVKVRARLIRRTMEGLMLSRSWSALEKDQNGKSKLITDEFRTFWDLFSKFLRAVYHGFSLPIHAVLTAMSHPDPLLVQFVCGTYPSHLLLRDPKTGSVPLHILARKAHTQRRRIDMLRLLFILLDANIDAAKEKDKFNRTSLHIALRFGKPWAFLKLLVAAYPGALHECDGKSGLVPFLLASVIDAKQHVDSNTAFLLLRTDPSVIEKYVTSLCKF